MRSVMIVLLACLLLSCGGRHNQSAPPASRAIADLPRFGDADPHAWSGVVPWQYPVHGIDVSKYQGDIDWHARPPRRHRLRLHQGDRGRRPQRRPLPGQLVGAPAPAGVPRGAYHYYYFCRPALEQAAWFINHVPKDASALPPVLDLEWTHKSRTCTYRPDAATVQREARIFLAALTAYYGKRPVIYTTVDFYRDAELWRLELPVLAALGRRPSLRRLPRPALALLAVHRHRPRRRHRRPDRPQRLRRLRRPVGGLRQRALRPRARALAGAPTPATAAPRSPRAGRRPNRRPPSQRRRSRPPPSPRSGTWRTPRPSAPRPAAAPRRRPMPG